MITLIVSFMVLCSFGANAQLVFGSGLFSSVSQPMPLVSTWSPTNYGTPQAYYFGDDATITQTGGTNWVFTWPDEWNNGLPNKPWNLTNNQYGKAPLALMNSLNGHHTVRFDGVDDYIRNTKVTNTQPFEMWMVAAYRGTTNSGNNYYWTDSLSSGNRFYLLQLAATGGKLRMYTDNGFDVNVGGITNKWVVWRFVVNGSNSRIETNNVLLASGNAGSFNQLGFIAASKYDFTLSSPMEIAEMIFYVGTNDGPTCTSINNGFRTKYDPSNF